MELNLSYNKFIKNCQIFNKDYLEKLKVEFLFINFNLLSKKPFNKLIIKTLRYKQG